MDRKTTITIGDQTFIVEADDLEKICDLGRGAYGTVEKMRHIPSGTIMAVKVSQVKKQVEIMYYIRFNTLYILVENYCYSQFSRTKTIAYGP